MVLGGLWFLFVFNAYSTHQAFFFFLMPCSRNILRKLTINFANSVLFTFALWFTFVVVFPGWIGSADHHRHVGKQGLYRGKGHFPHRFPCWPHRGVGVPGMPLDCSYFIVGQ